MVTPADFDPTKGHNTYTHARTQTRANSTKLTPSQNWRNLLSELHAPHEQCLTGISDIDDVELDGTTADTCPKKTGETVDRPQNNGNVKAVSPRHCPATSALRNCCFNCRAYGQSHKDNVRCTAVEEQLEAKEVQLSQPSSTSLLMISSGLT